MAVSAVVTPDHDMVAIVTLAGYTMNDAWYEGDSLYIEGATQQELDDAVVAYEPLHAGVLLEQQKGGARVAVDNAAGKARNRYITTTPGQSEVYIEKAEEAADFVSAGYPADASPYPFIGAEATATGNTTTEAADNILAQRSAWIAIGAAIEQERIGGKVTINAQLGPTGIDNARDAAVSALDAI